MKLGDIIKIKSYEWWEYSKATNLKYDTRFFNNLFQLSDWNSKKFGYDKEYDINDLNKFFMVNGEKYCKIIRIINHRCDDDIFVNTNLEKNLCLHTSFFDTDLGVLSDIKNYCKNYCISECYKDCPLFKYREENYERDTTTTTVCDQAWDSSKN